MFLHLSGYLLSKTDIKNNRFAFFTETDGDIQSMIAKTYACYNLNVEDRCNSSSGGIYPLIARSILCNGGVVYAACYDEKLNVFHSRIDKLEGIIDSQGSKYVSSNLNSVFCDILDDIEKNKKVLFVGTTCQCYGLKSFIENKRADESKVVLLDFACHGIPSRIAWRAYIDSREKKEGRLKSVNMRSKESGWSYANYSWKEEFKDGHIIVTPRREVSYMQGMLANIYLRPSCFHCVFKGVDRCTDITIGDYWGVWEDYPEMDDNKGTSFVILHTSKGEKIFNSIGNDTKHIEIDVEKVIKHNPCINISVKKSTKEKDFYNRLSKNEDFNEIINKLTRKSVIDETKNIVRSILRRILVSKKR